MGALKAAPGSSVKQQALASQFHTVSCIWKVDFAVPLPPSPAEQKNQREGERKERDRTLNQEYAKLVMVRSFCLKKSCSIELSHCLFPFRSGK